MEALWRSLLLLALWPLVRLMLRLGLRPLRLRLTGLRLRWPLRFRRALRLRWRSLLPLLLPVAEFLLLVPLLVWCFLPRRRYRSHVAVLPVGRPTAVIGPSVVWSSVVWSSVVWPHVVWPSVAGPRWHRRFSCTRRLIITRVANRIRTLRRPWDRGALSIHRLVRP